MRIILVPQYPSKMRYQEWFGWKLEREFKKFGFEVIMLGRKFIDKTVKLRSELDMFSPIEQAIELEVEQIKEYMKLPILDDDILFLCDLSFPGFFCNALYHKECSKMYAYCHATSLNKMDYFSSLRYSKFLTESAHAYLFDSIFVATNYHKQKLESGSEYFEGKPFWKNISVVSLPFPPKVPYPVVKKEIDIISVSRISPQKVDVELENRVVERFGQIDRPISNTWSEYFENLSKSKILLITAHEDTFGYQIVDAIMNGCIPIARNSFAYPELLPSDYLYNDERELINRIEYFLTGDNFKQVPKLICENKMYDFYKNIIHEMTREKYFPF